MSSTFICSICKQAVTAQDAVMHASESSYWNRAGSELCGGDYFAIYRWNEFAAESGDFEFVHKAEECLAEQIDRYLTKFSWGTFQTLHGSEIIGGGNRIDRTIDQAFKSVDRAMEAAK